jgi:hypothetical protein
VVIVVILSFLLIGGLCLFRGLKRSMMEQGNNHLNF